MVSWKVLIKREEALKLLKESNVKLNVVRSSSSESKEHFLKKAEICYDLMKQGKQFVTEAKFKGVAGFRRADIFVLDDMKVIEVIKTEKNESLTLKKLTYATLGISLEVARIDGGKK